MKAAMAPLALLALFAGAIQIPGVTHGLESFLEPTFAGSEYLGDQPSVGAEWLGLAVGTLLGIAGLALAFFVYERRVGTTLQLRDRLRPLHDFFANRWYFDHLYDAVFVNPSRSFGNFGRTVIESAFVQGFIVGGAGRIVGAGTALARGIQTGYLRAYAALLLFGAAAVLLYFLIASS